METKRGKARLGLEIQKAFLEHLGAGLVATDGVQYSDVASFSATAVEILNEIINPGVSMQLEELEVSFVQRFVDVKGGTTNASMSYYWEAREEFSEGLGATATMRTGDYIPLSATISKSIASAGIVEDTLEGYVPVASLPNAPIRVRLTALTLAGGSMTGEVKNESYVRLVGNIIPGVS